MLGAEKQKSVGLNLRMSYQGGDRYTPVDVALSQSNQEAIEDDTKTFTKQWPSSVLAHATVSYKINKKKSTHELALKVLNATGQKDYYGFQYNYLTQSVEENSQVIFIPNLSYKIEF